MARLGKETGASLNGRTGDDNGLAKGFSSSFTNSFPFLVDKANFATSIDTKHN